MSTNPKKIANVIQTTSAIEWVYPYSDCDDCVVRSVTITGQPWFVLADLCKVLDIANASDVSARLDDGVVTIYPIVDSMGRDQNVTIVSEAGMYDVVLDSRKPEAKAVRRWITSEVMPSIRKTGVAATSDEAIVERAWEIISERARLAEARNAQLEPKAKVADDFLTATESAVHVVEWAKRFGMTQNDMYALLRERGIIFKLRDPQNSTWRRAAYMQSPKRGYELMFRQVQEKVSPTKWVTVLLVTARGQADLPAMIGVEQI